MAGQPVFPFPVLDALPLGAHRLAALTDEALARETGVRIAFAGRQGGVSEGMFESLNCSDAVGDNIERVRRNRRLICEALGAPDAQPVVPKQVHETRMVHVESAAADAIDAACEDARSGADGVVVGAQGVVALLNFADCLPLIIVSPSGRFAVVHAGWRGAYARIASKAAAALASGDACEPADFNAYIGPHIRQECFEVDEGVESQFAREFGNDVIVSAHHVSLARVVTLDLMQAGLVGNRIADAGICTQCNSSEYFSYRATDGECGRQAAAAVLLRSE